MTATRTAKKPLVVTISPVASSMARSLPVINATWPRKPGLRLEDEDTDRDDRRPQTELVALGRLRDRTRPDDLTAHAIDLLPLVPRLLGIELQAHRRREHRRRQILGV